MKYYIYIYIYIYFYRISSILEIVKGIYMLKISIYVKNKLFFKQKRRKN